MNRDEAIRRAEIAMAWARGEVVQYRTPYILGDKWDDVPPVGGDHVPSFFDDTLKGKWRIKPKPLEWWSFVSKANRPVATIIADEQPLSTPEGWAALGGRWVRMREVE